MPVISDAAIANAARTAGLNGQQAAIAVAIALAESGGNTHAHNAIPPDNSYGLWQINMLGSMGPARRQQFGLSSNEELYDPVVNAKAMFAISNGGTNWRAWTTYTRGTYLRYLARGSQAVGSEAGIGTSPNGGLQTTPVGLSGQLDSITQFFKLLSNPRFWIRLGILNLGVGLAFYGLLKLTGDNQLSGTSKSLASAAIGLLPGGGTVMQATKAVAKVAKK